MSQDAHVSDLLPAYALDCLDQDEMALVSEHLAACPSCRLELESYQAVTGQLAVAVPEAVPPDHLKRQLMKQVQPEQPTATAEPESSWWQQLSSLWRRAAPAWGVISLALIVVLAVGNLMLRQQIDGSESGPEGFHIVSLSGTDLAAGATGTLVISGDGEYGTLIVDGLSPLDRAQQYQLWLIKDGQHTDGGVFSVNHEGYGAMEISSPSPLSSFPSFGITIEPAGGSPGPTGDKVLGGSL